MNIQQFNGFKLDLLQSILWQYNEATNLLSLLNFKQLWYNTYQTKFWSDWYNNIFNLSSPTLNLFGATVWSIILDIPLFIQLQPQPDPGQIWGFNAYTVFPATENDNFNFNNGCFADSNQEISLTIQEQQFLLRLRYFQLSNLGDIVDINKFLAYLCANSYFGYTGTIYIIDNLDMTATYHFTDSSFPSELFLAITTQDVFPRPAGVSLTYTGL